MMGNLLLKPGHFKYYETVNIILSFCLVGFSWWQKWDDFFLSAESTYLGSPLLGFPRPQVRGLGLLTTPGQEWALQFPTQLLLITRWLRVVGVLVFLPLWPPYCWVVAKVLILHWVFSNSPTRRRRGTFCWLGDWNTNSLWGLPYRWSFVTPEGWKS